MKKLRSLSTLLAGIIIGVGISFAPDIYATTSKLLGKEVDKVMEVELNNKNIGQAAVMEGTSYLPVRAVAEGLDLKIDVTKDKIKLTSPSAEENAIKAGEEQEQANQKHKAISEISSQIRTVKTRIAKNETTISGADFSIKQWEHKLSVYRPLQPQYPDIYTDKVAEAESEISKIKSEADKAQEELTSDKVLLADLESQLAELQK
ncbi:hypothetical protein ACI2LM_13465 [Paenibacillus lautus]|uniref:hypothetical protein n=1 Tax=Paenibacillus lautus TaxID=1401 RepID=UPI003851148E